MRKPDDWTPTDAEMLDWAFANGTRLHLLADAYVWRHGTPELVRAALTLAMREDRRRSRAVVSHGEPAR